jgi:hypothetical protein
MDGKRAWQVDASRAVDAAFKAGQITKDERHERKAELGRSLGAATERKTLSDQR